MSSETSNEVSRSPVGRNEQAIDESNDGQPSGDQQVQERNKRQPATIIVKGEAVDDKDGESKVASSDKNKASQKLVSTAKLKLRSLLPALADDVEVGVLKPQVVTRDGKADLAFNGTLLASAAPQTAPKGEWQEYRIYETDGGKHVFSKLTCNVLEEEEGQHEAEIFDPAPTSVPSKILRGAHDLTHSQPLTWKDAAVSFFGYDPLAKALYRKFGSQFEEQIS